MLTEQSVVCPVLIGRDAPLSTVFGMLDHARTERGGVLLVSGDAGVGKSRLVRALVERARSLGFVALQGACFETDRAQPYAPILDLVRVLAATASPALAAHYFAPAGAELVTLFPELRSILADATPRQTLDPEEDRRRLFHAVTDAVQTLARVQPLLLVIEDVHWSDDSTLDLILHLARRVGPQPIVLALTFRSDEIGSRLGRLLAELDRARVAAEVRLRPLDMAAVSAMLQAIFGSQVAFGSAFIGGLHALTEGNPFFIEEMLKALLVAGDLAHTDGRWRARPLTDVRVPRTATDAVGRRLAGLSEQARQVAAVAAVAGRRFEFRLLHAVTPHGDLELLALLRELVEAQLVVEESADRFAFRHALTREAIRAQLLARERVALHQAIAAALEQQEGAGTEADEALAYHAFEAGAWELARRAARRAADHAITLGAPREALQQIERAVVATVHLGQRPESSLIIARGHAHETLGAFTLAHEDFNAALDAARNANDRHTEWAALHALGRLWTARDYARAGGYRRDALEVARAIDDAVVVARSLNQVGNWHVNGEEPHAGIPHHDEALAIFERANDAHGVAETVDLLAIAHHLAGMQSTAVALYERAVLLFTALDDRRALAYALAVLPACGPSHHASSGPVHTSAHAAAILTDERAVRLSTEIGWRSGESFARWLLADCLAWRGDYARALPLAREAVAIADEIHHLSRQCAAQRVLGLIALDLCAPMDARAPLRAAFEIAQRFGSATWIRWTGATLAIALARSGDCERASAVLDEVDQRVASPTAGDSATAGVPLTMGTRQLALARGELALAMNVPAQALAAVESIGERVVGRTPRASLLRAQALAALGRWTDATAALDVARDAAREQEARSLLWRIDALQGAVCLGERRRRDARQAFDAARAGAAELVVALDEPALVATFWLGVDRAAPPPPARTARQAAKAAYGGLTRRERDTAARVAHGESNRTIGRMLGIGERTVEGHVASALTKLGFSSRAQLAVWAAEQNLGGVDRSPRPPRR